MAQPIANYPPPAPPTATTAAQGNPGAQFQQAIASDAFQQLLYTTQIASLYNENQVNPQAPALLTTLEDTGQLNGTFFQDYPPATNPTTTNPTTGANATGATATGAAANINLPGSATAAAFTAPGLLLATLIQQLYGLGTTAQAQAAITGPAANLVAGPATTAQGTTATVQANPVAEQLLLQIAGNPRVATPATPAAQNAAPATEATGAPAGAAVAPPPTPGATATETAVPLPPQTNTTINVVGNAVATAQNMVVPAQTPIVIGLNGGTPPTPEQTPAFPEPVVAPVAATALPSAQVGDRPVMAGNRLAAIAEQVSLQQSPRTAASTAFQAALNQSASGASGSSAGPRGTQTTPNAPAQATAGEATGASARGNAAAEAQANTAAASTSTAYVRTYSEAAPEAAAQARVAPAAPAATEMISQPSSNAGPSPAANTVGTSAPVDHLAVSGNAQAAAANATPTPTTNRDGSENASAAMAFATNSTGSLAQTAPAAATAASPTPTPTLASQVAEGVVTHAESLSTTGTTEFRMRLDPPELGPVNVQLVATGDGVRGHVVVASDSVRQMIESQLPELRQRLEANGVTIQNFSVSTDPSGGGRSPWQGPAANPTPPDDQQTAQAPAPSRFRISAGRKRGQLDVVV